LHRFCILKLIVERFTEKLIQIHDKLDEPSPFELLYNQVKSLSIAYIPFIQWIAD